MLRALRVAVLLALVACDDDGDPLVPPPQPDAPPVVPDPYWLPQPGEYPNFDVQLAGTPSVSTERDVYILDLWDVAVATTLDYGGGVTVEVPAGPLAGQIETLHAADTIVVCQVEAGAIRLDDPDAAQFPGHDATVPDRPADPAIDSVIGWSIIGDPNTRYLDLRAAARAMWRPLLFKRFELADTLGCDAVAVSWIDQVDPGFAFMGAEAQATYEEIVAELHRLEVSAGMHVKTMLGAQLSDGFTDSYDFAIVERCAEFNECDLSNGFERADKAVFGIDFTTDGVTDRDGDKIPDGVTFELGCAREILPTDWIHKTPDAALRATAAPGQLRSECAR